MRFVHCPYCGERLIKKEIGDEGLIPYCNRCQVPLWDMFTTSIICAVINEYNEIALLRQKYVSETKYVCVAGIMKADLKLSGEVDAAGWFPLSESLERLREGGIAWQMVKQIIEELPPEAL